MKKNLVYSGRLDCKEGIGILMSYLFVILF